MQTNLKVQIYSTFGRYTVSQHGTFYFDISDQIKRDPEHFQSLQLLFIDFDSEMLVSTLLEIQVHISEHLSLHCIALWPDIHLRLCLYVLLQTRNPLSGIIS